MVPSRIPDSKCISFRQQHIFVIAYLFSFSSLLPYHTVRTGTLQFFTHVLVPTFSSTYLPTHLTEVTIGLGRDGEERERGRERVSKRAREGESDREREIDRD